MGASLVAFGLVVSGLVTALGVSPAAGVVQGAEIGDVVVSRLSRSLGSAVTGPLADLSAQSGDQPIELTIWPTGLPEPTPVDLSKAYDWVKVDAPQNVIDTVRKDTTSQLLSLPTSMNGAWVGGGVNYPGVMSWEGGYPTPTESGTDRLAYSGSTGDAAFVFSAGVDTQWRRLDVYWGCQMAECEMEIDDGSGNVTTSRIAAMHLTPEINEKTSVFYRGSATASLEVRLSKLDGLGVVALSAYAVTNLGSSLVQGTVSVSESPASLNLSDQVYVDWAHFTDWRQRGFNHKAAPAEQVIGDLSFVPGVRIRFDQGNDFEPPVSWADGTPLEGVEDTQQFVYAWNGVSVPLDVPAGLWTVEAYTWAHDTDAYYTLVDSTGTVVASAHEPQGGPGETLYRKLTVDVAAASPEVLTLMAASDVMSNRYVSGVSMPAITVRPTHDARPVLRAALDRAEGLVEVDYTGTAWDVFVSSGIGADAQAVWDNLLAPEDEVLAAVDALNAAIAELQSHPRADTTELLAVIGQADGLDRDDYAPVVWALIVSGTAAARAVAGNPNASQGEVDRAAQALQHRLAVLVREVNVVIPPQLSTLTPVVDGDLEVLPGYVATSGTSVTYVW
ncbi:MAG: hypothetical protein LBH48_05115, partial [Bifidobacteriaceae bacterium]|nr:hypothetical protein [Bifidobacteriaceae bacterium]